MLHDHVLDEPLGRATFDSHNDSKLLAMGDRHSDSASKTKGYGPPRIIGFVSDVVDSGTSVPELENM